MIVMTLGLACAAPQQQKKPKRAPPFAPTTMAYVLQAEGLGGRAEAVRALERCGRDLVVIDPTYAGSEDSRWTRAEVAAIRAGRKERRVIAYLSIGEAESYRAYWKTAWDADEDGVPDEKAPAFLEPVNPDWEGNYKVKYWRAAWQKLILKALDEIVRQGFDGVYLDIVDAFEYFEELAKGRINPETKRPFRAEMAAWITAIAKRARKQRPGFLVLCQNGSQLLTDRALLRTVSGLAVEDLFTTGDERQDAGHTREVLRHVAAVRAARKPVLVVEYPETPELRKRATGEARERKLPLLLTDRELKTLGRAR